MCGPNDDMTNPANADVVACACDKRDRCGCEITFDAAKAGAICLRCQMHQYQSHRTRIRRPAR